LNNNVRQFGRPLSAYENLLTNQRAQPQNQPITISVSNLPSSTTESDVWALFGPFGAVTNVSLNPYLSEDFRKSNLTKKTATVVMPIYDEAIFAIMSLNDQSKMIGNQFTTLKVTFKCTQILPRQ